MLLLWCDRLARASLVIGLVLMLLPAWPPSFRIGFFVLLAGTMVHLVTARIVGGRMRKAGE